MPCRSRRSRKISWPWSRRRWTHPARRAFAPASDARKAPQVWVRYGVARGSTGASAASRSPGGESVMTGYRTGDDRSGEEAMLGDSLAYATLPTSDLAGLRRFYADVL